MGSNKPMSDDLSEFLKLCILLSTLLFAAAAARRGSVVKTLRDNDGDFVVSEGGRFQLGFFTPNGLEISDVKRYVGIWYNGSKPEVVVWVANREKPLHNNNGVFTIKDGSLQVLDSKTNNTLWSTDHTLWSTNNTSNVKPTSNNILVVLMDTGNLILEGLGVNGTTTTLWQSFQNPTDTFLPGMNMTNQLKFTSWKSAQDPSPGNFTFFKDLESSYIIEKLSERYWTSKELWQNFYEETDENGIVEIINLLSNNHLPNLSSSYLSFQNQGNVNYSRLVMSFSGEIQFLRRYNLSGQWRVTWSEPVSKCSTVKACGSFASCQSYTRHTCKCLPGFEPKSKDKWNSGDYSDGCQRQTEICPTQLAPTREFFTINVKVRKTLNIIAESNDNKNCKIKCLESCVCQAYSEVTTYIGKDSIVACAIWDDELKNIWEYGYGYGDVDINVRFKHSDIEYTKLDCEPCGSNIVPYPLSTGPNCGDPLYRNFICLDRLLFRIANDNYSVTNIDPQLNTFTIKTISTNRSICRTTDTAEIQKLLELEHSSTFKVRGGCDIEFYEIDIQWEKPLEPICNSPEDCISWRNSLCNSSPDGKKRCLCKPSFKWTSTGCLIPPEDVLDRPPPEKGENRTSIIVLVTIAGLIVIIFSLVLYMHKRRKLQNIRDRRTSYWRNQEPTHLYESEKRIRDFMGSGMFGEDDRKAIEVPVFDFDTILIATDNFSEANKLGRGGFGTVYKGLFPGGLEIAIKRLSQGSAQGVDEFKNEAILIAKLQHRNLVRLLGYCVAEEEKMLVYEYMPNKSLDFFIFDRTLCLLVNWEMRFNIIVGIVRGLVYLHEDSRLRIIHRDMKTSNVLLDGKMNPKISDFGLARIFDGTQTEAITTKRIVGTYGYMSPEYALDGSFSVKSDVFSFGIVVLEIVSGRRNTGFYKSKEALNLLGYVWNLWREKRALEIAEVAIRESCNPSEIVKCVAVGLLCVQEDPNDRPTMSNIAFMLSSGSDPASLPDPKRPAFIDNKSSPSTSSATSSGLKQEVVSHDCSLLEPR